MNSPTAEIVICMGSSCFSRGNKKALQQIKEFLRERNLEDQVVFKGSHCLGQCEKGPVLKINNLLIHQVDASNIASIMEGILEKKIQDQ